jgi:hypothetical protein
MFLNTVPVTGALLKGCGDASLQQLMQANTASNFVRES